MGIHRLPNGIVSGVPRMTKHECANDEGMTEILGGGRVGLSLKPMAGTINAFGDNAFHLASYHQLRLRNLNPLASPRRIRSCARTAYAVRRQWRLTSSPVWCLSAPARMTVFRRASNSSTVGLKMRQPGLRMKPFHCNL